MRIAYLTGEYPRVTDTFIQREVAALRQLGASDGTTVSTFSVRSPQPSQSLSPSQQKERSQTQYLLPPDPIKLLVAHASLLRSRPKRYLKAVAKAWATRQPGLRGLLYQLIYFIEAGLLAHQLDQQGMDHLHNHFGDSSCTVAMLAATMGNFGYSFTLHGPGIFFEPYRWRLDEKISQAEFVSCISHFCRSQTMIFAPLEAWDKLHIVHCGIDPAEFAEADSREAGSENPGSRVAVSGDGSRREVSEKVSATHPKLLYVGRLAAAKGLPILLKSLAVLKRTFPNIQLTVVGDGADRKILTEQTASLDLTDQVEFVGYQAPEAVRDYLQRSDVFVMSSFAEGVPVVLMEAMMAGLPVVATQVAGISELVEEGVNGFLVPPSDEALLTERIQTLLGDEVLRDRFGQQGQQKVRSDFNIHCEAKKLYRLITQTVASRAIESPEVGSVEQSSGFGSDKQASVAGLTRPDIDEATISSSDVNSLDINSLDVNSLDINKLEHEYLELEHISAKNAFHNRTALTTNSSDKQQS